MRHSDAGLSVRQRTIRVPCLIRPPLAWSNATSTTSSGRSAIHSSSRSPCQRLGSPRPRPVGRSPVLGDDALAIAKPGAGGGRVARDGRHPHARLIKAGPPSELLERRPPLGERTADQRLPAEREQVERDVGGGRAARQQRHAACGRVYPLLQGSEVLAAVPGVDHYLAVEHVAARREAQLREVALKRPAAARLERHLRAVDERDRAKAVELGLIGPALAYGDLGGGARQLRLKRRRERERHRAMVGAGAARRRLASPGCRPPAPPPPSRSTWSPSSGSMRRSCR